MSRGRTMVAVVTAAVAVGAIGYGSTLLPHGTTTAAAPAQRSTAGDVWPGGSSGVRNVSFFYQGSIDLATASDADVRRTLGRPSIVVAQRGDDEKATTDAIHRLGAKAYRYVQFYWSPTSEDYDGLDLSAHPEWAFCSTGDTPAVGERESDGQVLAFIDGNERAVRQHFRAKFAALVDQGWDGVFIDRGEAATTYAANLEGTPVWSRRSTCTDDPVRAGARFSDAFVDLLGLAHGAGLGAMMNNGRPPLDPINPMRPDPGDPDCRGRRWSACRHLTDVWGRTDLILSETATRPRLDYWDRTFRANRAAERHSSYGRRTVALVTTTSAGGHSRQKVYYAWSRVKLFDLSVAVMTGDDRCLGSEGTICNRYGTYPELVDVQWGAPRYAAPRSRDCAPRSTIRCIWVRHYGRGINVLNARSVDRVVTIGTGTRTCRYVWDVAESRALAGGRCVFGVRLTLGAFTGRPLLMSTSPHG